jgi:hypothetical protein
MRPSVLEFSHSSPFLSSRRWGYAQPMIARISERAIFLRRVLGSSISDAILASQRRSADLTRTRQETFSASNLHSAKEEAMKRPNCIPAVMTDESDYDGVDVTSLLHPDPAQAFARPSEVVNDCDLTLSEKRAILASWASDACAVEANPVLRRMRRCTPVSFDDVMDALRALDRQAAERRRPVPHYRRVPEPGRSIGRNFRGGESGDQGSRLH